MKKLIFLIAIAALTLSCKTNRYTVTGNIADATGTVILIDQNGQMIDSTSLDKNSSFTFSGELDYPEVAYIECPDIEFLKMIFIGGGKTTIDTKPNKAVVASGTKLNDQLEKLNIKISELTEQGGGEEEFTEILQSFFDNNADNALGELLFLNLAEVWTSSEAEEAYSKLSKHGKELEDIKNIMEYFDKAKNTEVGKPFVDVVLKDANGDLKSLAAAVSSNNYVLLDFWASWCGPCMEDVGNLKEAYDNFHEMGFEIFGVSLDEEREEWLDACKENDINWIQTCSLDAPNKSADDYSITTIPSNFLIDANRTIVAKNLFGGELQKTLSKLMK